MLFHIEFTVLNLNLALPTPIELIPEYVQDLFNTDGSFCYNNFEEQYLQRRFHGKLSNHPSNASSTLPSICSSTVSLSHSRRRQLHEMKEELPPNDEHDAMSKQKRFENFVRVHNGDKPLLILDVDNTLLYARFFSEEMKIDDVVTYFKDGNETEPNAKVIKLQVALTLSVIDERLVSKLGSESTEVSVWLQNNNTLRVKF